MVSASHASPGWSEALRLVTGYEVDLRSLCDGNAMICPGVIILQQDAHAGASLLMAENQGQPAIDRLVQELNNLARIMPALQAAKLGLMDIDLLRRAASVMARQSSTLAGLQANAGQLVAATSASADGSDGAFRRSLAVAVARVEQDVSAQVASYQTGERPIESLIDGATQALRSFGTRMARAFLEARPTLIQVATSFWDGANTNLAAYWLANGWGPGGPNSRLFERAPATAEALWTAAVMGYSSAGLPGLPPGTPPVVADLHDGWGAFGVALTQRLGQVLDAMDEEANAAFAALSDAYRAVITALGGSLPAETGGSNDVYGIPSMRYEGQPLTAMMAAEPAMVAAEPAQLMPMMSAVPAQLVSPLLGSVEPESDCEPARMGTPAGIADSIDHRHTR